MYIYIYIRNCIIIYTCSAGPRTSGGARSKTDYVYIYIYIYQYIDYDYTKLHYY